MRCRYGFGTETEAPVLVQNVSVCASKTSTRLDRVDVSPAHTEGF